MRLPEVLALFPVRPTAWWEGVAAGRYPRPVKLGPKLNAWRVKDIRRLLDVTAGTTDDAA
jgi:predicted DNA-binding transcriptional regulator AlpA